jgi:hypothetical protein
MSELAAISELLVMATESYNPEILLPGAVFLGELGLCIAVQIQAHQSYPGAEMLVVHYAALEEGRKDGIGVTCVGVGSDTDQAARESLANYACNVIPVLDQWKTGHNCLVDVTEVELKGRGGPLHFEVIGGPLTCRGLQDVTMSAGTGLEGYVPRMIAELRNAPITNALHWLECFGGKQHSGEIDCTCRLDNRDWRPGQRLLEADAKTWPNVEVPLQSRRQFILLVPKDPNLEEPPPKSFLARLFGR